MPGVNILPVASITISPRRLDVDTLEILLSSIKTFPIKASLFFPSYMVTFWIRVLSELITPLKNY